MFAAGFCIIGGQLTLNAFTSNFYPAQVRATGTGWALGVGRFGSILGPLFGSLLLAMHLPVEQIFFFCAIPAVLAALLIIQVRSPAEAVSAPMTTQEAGGSGVQSGASAGLDRH
ncbi:4-hydroxybenzoate transporter PcaK [compost metagenome]